MRRISVEDRAKEIQKSYGSTRTVPLATDSPSPKSAGGRGKQQQVDAGDSWKRSYEDLMAGLADSPDPAQSSPLSPAGGPTSPKGLGAESVGDSSYGDSLEISAADLEVGEYAKRRASEKTADRQRRMALDVAPHTLVNKGAPPKVAASPDIANKMRNRPGESGAGAGARGFQMSAALSSIGNFSDDEDEVTGASRKGVQRYGSVEKSDADLFKKLGGTEAGRAAAVAPSTTHVSSLDDASDEDEDGNDEDDDDQGSDLAHSNEFESGEGAGDDDDDDEENEAEEEQKAAPKQPDLEAIRQRWLPSTAAAAAVQEQQKEEAEVPVPAATEAPRVVVVPSPANADDDEDEDEGDDKEDEAEMDAIQPGAKLLTAVGSASMVTSVPPPPPPVMSESAELTLTTNAPAISMWASATSLSADSNNAHDDSRASTSTPPAPSYAASLAVPSLPPVQATEGAAAAALGLRGSLRYAVEHEEQDQDQSLVEQASFSYPAPVEADPAPPAPPAPAVPAVSAPAPAPARAVSVADIVPTPDTVPVSYFKPAEAGLGSSGAHLSASGNAGHFSGLPRQAPVGPSLSGGQAAVNKIVAFEVDPFALGLGGVSSSLRGSSGQGLGSVGASLAVRSVQSRSSLSPSRPPPPPATGWPKELPLVAPSAEDLHAHIAVMESTNKRRIAAATAQKIKNFKNKSADSASALGVELARQTGKTLPKRSRSAAASSHASGTTAPAVPAAVNRLEQGTARLARQYEELQQELQNLRQDRSGRESKAVQASSTLPSRSLVSGPSPTRIPAPSKAAATSSSSSSSSSRVGRGAKGSQPAVAASVGTGDDATLDQSSGVWQSVALQTMKKIVAEGDRLGEREKELAVREEALRLRQSVGEAGVYAALGDAALSAHRGLSASAAAAASVPPHRVKDEEFLALQQSEALAVAEVARLKAELFELQNADVGVSPNDTSIQIRAPKPKRQHYKAGGAPAPVEEGIETVTISKAEHDKLLHDLAEQEVLITGFQKENERLMQALKQREAEETSRKAHFYDKQESLNKELLRLRNAETGAPAVRRSAEALRQELDADATIRALKERLAMAEAGAGQREKDLQMTIDKLRKENRELAATSARVPSKVFSGADEDHDALAVEVKRLEGEVTTLRGKLAWYAENQSLLAGLEKDKAEAQAAASALKRELRKKGVDGRTIEGIVRQAQAGSDSSSPTEEGGADSSMFSSATKGASARAHGSGRSQADIRKIKELEEAVSELQECLRKRHPDSITSLVRAAAMSDSVQAERQRESEAVETMRRELVEAKTAYELKLRSIRQEHERLEVGYKQRILSLEGLAAASSASTPTPTKASPSGATKGAPVRTLPQAQARIKCVAPSSLSSHATHLSPTSTLTLTLTHFSPQPNQRRITESSKRSASASARFTRARSTRRRRRPRLSCAPSSAPALLPRLPPKAQTLQQLTLSTPPMEEEQSTAPPRPLGKSTSSASRCWRKSSCALRRSLAPLDGNFPTSSRPTHLRPPRKHLLARLRL